MKKEYNSKIIVDENKPVDTGKICLYNVCSPYPNYDVGFNWLNCEYPYLHMHDHWEILLITNGEINHFINGKNIVMKEGDVSLIRPHDFHSVGFLNKKESTHLSFLVKTEYMHKILSNYSSTLYDEIISRNDHLSIHLNEELLLGIVNASLNFKSFKMNVEQKVYYSKIIVNKIINIIIESSSIMLQNNPDWMTNFLFLLNNPFLDTSDLTKLAKYTPYSYSRLAHIFKNVTGRTMKEYCNHIKIQHAKELLRNTDLSFGEICTKLNFESYSYFHRLFKSHTGYTPISYRNMTTPKKNNEIMV